MKATMTSSVVDLEPKPQGPVAPIRHFIVSDISLTTIILLLFGTSTCTVRPWCTSMMLAYGLNFISMWNIQHNSNDLTVKYNLFEKSGETRKPWN